MRPSLRKSPSSHKQRETLNWNAAPNMLARQRAQKLLPGSNGGGAMLIAKRSLASNNDLG